ncbi:CDP-glycerol glycerophosphotransferase family protein [Leuconostoc mesenteroides]|uniref:CDP-glycerol glycerophosphotransferase family protein n=1 Tax=Leuconostoc mesenteroides TaxID=1245 RepID=UPI00311E0243
MNIQVRRMVISKNYAILTLSEKIKSFQAIYRKNKGIQQLPLENGENFNEYIVDLSQIYIDNPYEEHIFDFFVETATGNKRVFVSKNTNYDLKNSIDTLQEDGSVLIPYITRTGHLAAYAGEKYFIWQRRLNKRKKNIFLKNFIISDSYIRFNFINEFEEKYNEYEYYLYSSQKVIKLNRLSKNSLGINVSLLEDLEFSLKAIKQQQNSFEELTFYAPKDINNSLELARGISETDSFGIQAFLNKSNKIIIKKIYSRQDYMDYLLEQYDTETPKKISVQIAQGDENIQIKVPNKFSKTSRPKIFFVSKQASFQVEYRAYRQTITLSLDSSLVQFSGDYQIVIVDTQNIFEEIEGMHFIMQGETICSFQQIIGRFVVSLNEGIIKVSELNTALLTETSNFNEITNVRTINDTLQFDVINMLPNNVKIILESRRDDKKIDVPFSMFQGHYEIPLYSLFYQLDINVSKWDFRIEYQIGNEVIKKGLHIVQQFFSSKADKYLFGVKADKKIISQHSTAYRNHILLPYVTGGNYLAISLRDKYFIYKEKYNQSAVIKEIDMKSGMLEVDFWANADEQFTISQVQLRLRSDVLDDIKILDVKKIDHNNYRVAVDLKNYKLKEFYYELFAEMNFANDGIAFARLEKASKEIRYRINNSIFKYNMENKEDHSVDYPFVTDRNVLYIAHRVRDKDERFMDKVNEWMAAAVNKIFHKQLSNKNIWLVFEKNSSTAQDNGYYFFKWVYENHHELPIYYVIKKDSKDIDKLKGMEDRVLIFMSLKHLLFLAASKMLIAPETRGHVFTWRQQKGRIRKLLNKKKLIFLQHGVTAFKHNDSVLAYTSPSAVSKYVVTSDNEQQIIHDGLFYPKKDIWVTGFSRWDVLIDKSSKISKKKIFVMPTWRGWLDSLSNEEFKTTPYYKNYMAILNSELLNDILAQNDILLEFFLHPKFKEYTSDFKSTLSNIKILNFEDTMVNEKLMESSLLITDYSSVAWDEHYMNKPVVFYQFDYHDYMNLTGSYIDIQENLFGPLAQNIDDLIDIIRNQINHQFVNDDLFSKLRDNNFKYIDKNNSKRIFENIQYGIK